MQDERSIYRWIKGPSSAPVVDIFTAGYNFGDSDVASTATEALEVLRIHWKRIWNRVKPCPTELCEACLQTPAYKAWRENQDRLGILGLSTYFILMYTCKIYKTYKHIYIYIDI